tara:strand:+ start:136 stop:627 length:492 start_codon:yes stop_codon:yes gene_type:complete
MITFDIAIIVFLSYWAIRGFFKGFASEVLSLLIWSTSIFLSIKYFYIPSSMIETYISSSDLSNFLTIIMLFIITFFTSAISGFLISKLINMIGLYSYDKVLGLLMGGLKGLVFTMLVIFSIEQTTIKDSSFIQESQITPHFDYFLNKYIKTSESLFDSLVLKI